MNLPDEVEDVIDAVAAKHDHITEKTDPLPEPGSYVTIDVDEANDGRKSFETVFREVRTRIEALLWRCDFVYGCYALQLDKENAALYVALVPDDLPGEADQYEPHISEHYGDVFGKSPVEKAREDADDS